MFFNDTDPIYSYGFLPNEYGSYNTVFLHYKEVGSGWQYQYVRDGRIYKGFTITHPLEMNKCTV